ncbi:MAG: hypothetical protein M3Z17_03460, partial [Gemmatimonadota bacterium]|nr:hypothetical protein [Gemmatimonadota bacterium]
EQEFPQLAERYRNTYAGGYEAGKKYREGLSRFFTGLCARYGVRSWSRGTESEEDESVDALVLDEQLLLAI